MEKSEKDGKAMGDPWEFTVVMDWSDQGVRRWFEDVVSRAPLLEGRVVVSVPRRLGE